MSALTCPHCHYPFPAGRKLRLLGTPAPLRCSHCQRLMRARQLPSLLLRGQGISHHPAPYPGRCWRRRGGCCRCKLRRVIQATRVRAGVGRALRSSRRASGQCQGTGRSRGEATKRTACIAGFCHRSPPDPE